MVWLVKSVFTGDYITKNGKSLVIDTDSLIPSWSASGMWSPSGDLQDFKTKDGRFLFMVGSLHEYNFSIMDRHYRLRLDSLSFDITDTDRDFRVEICRNEPPAYFYEREVSFLKLRYIVNEGGTYGFRFWNESRALVLIMRFSKEGNFMGYCTFGEDNSSHLVFNPAEFNKSLAKVIIKGF